MTGTDPLLDLLALCVVRIDRDGEFEGTGFFVAPDMVLTCGHVVHGSRPITVFTADGGAYSAEPITALLSPDDPRAAFYPQPDAALLHVSNVPVGQPCVRLEAADPAVGSDTLHLTAYTKGENAPDAVARSGAMLRLERLFEQEGCTLYKLREGQVIGGFSGGPLLNIRTGSVCAIVDSSRSPTLDLGGFGVPLAAVAAIDPGLLTRNADFNAGDARWARAHEEQARLVAERDGRRDLLPLLPPVLELEWGPNVPPSELLRPRHAVVPFVPRGDLLGQVMRWRESDEPLRVLVLTGAGGFGKSRTAAEVCREAEDAGWTAGPIDADVDGIAGLTELSTWPGRTMIALDYAETRPELVTNLLKRLLRRRNGAPCRVVLVVRQGASRQPLIDLFATGDARDELARLLRRAEFVGLGHGERELDRRELFASASTAFARVLSGAVAAVPDLYADHFERPLFVLAAALLAVANPDLDVSGLSAEELMGEILDRHEASYWERSDDRLNLGLHRDDRRTAVALAALCGLSSDQDDERLVRLVPSLRDAPAERVLNVVRWLRDLYGPRSALEPDLLAEVLVGRTVIAFSELVGAVLDAASDAQLTRALVVLSRVAGWSEAVREMVRSTLDDRLPALVTRAEADELVTALLLAVGAARPVFGAIRAQDDAPVRSASAGMLAVEIGRLAVVGLRTAVDRGQDTVRPRLSVALVKLSKVLSDTGRPAEGLAPIEEAVDICRALASSDHAGASVVLAFALNDQACLLGEVGRPADGLVVINEVVTFRRALVQADLRHLPDLAASLNNLANLLTRLGRPADSLAPIDEAVIHFRSLAKIDPARYLPELASALDNQSIRLGQEGRPTDGLVPAAEAVDLYRALASVDSTGFLPDLARALGNQSNRLTDAGRPADALAPVNESVMQFRALANSNPTRYLPNLATSLNSQARLLAVLGRPVDGLVPINVALTILRALAQDNPIRFLPDLGMALTTQVGLLAESGPPIAAVAPMSEAVSIRHALAKLDPPRFLPNLITTLYNQSSLLADIGRPADGLACIGEVVGICRALVESDQTRFLPDLAMALNSQAKQLAQAGQPAGSLVPGDEAVRRYRELADADPTRFQPKLASALLNHSSNLADVGQLAESLAPGDEAVRHYRELADAEPTRFRPRLAMALLNHSGHLVKAGQLAESLAPSDEAIYRYRDLAEADSARFIPELAIAVGNRAWLHEGLGHPSRASELFADVLAEHPEPGWSRGTLLLARANWLAGSGRSAAAATDAAEALDLLDAADDRGRRGEVRRLLRGLRTTYGETVDAALLVRQHELPVWLRVSESDSTTERVIRDWIEKETWAESFSFLSEQGAVLLSDRAEAGLEHLIDTNPDQAILEQHLALLRAARARGVDSVRVEFTERLRTERLTDRIRSWIATDTWTASAEHLAEHAQELLTDDAEQLLSEFIVEQPGLLRYLGLLGVAREIGVEAAHSLVTDRVARDTARATRPPAGLLSLARLVAGLDEESAELQFAHALAALEAEGGPEAIWALTRCRDACASWERSSFVRRLEEFADTYPEVDLAPLHRALSDEGP